ncbi:MAG: hypothetical protein WED34_01605 [Planctomycetales bacterium]
MNAIRPASTRLLSVALLFGAVPAAADEPPLPGPKEALESAAAVFVGKMVGKEREGAVYEVKFEVSRSWKGPRGKTITVSTPTSAGLAGYRFRDGETYPVYCLPRFADAAETALPWTNAMTRTHPLSEAAADIKELGEPRGDDKKDGSAKE